jgi:hypothetical protein
MDQARAELRNALGHRPLSRAWAKAEILVGLLAAGLGLLLDDRALGREAGGPGLLAARLLLFTLGGYLALAGHRSHLYQSGNDLAAYLAAVLRTGEEGPSHDG